MKSFNLSDVRPHGAILNAGTLVADNVDLIDCPLDWQKLGLQQTASGYGRKLTSRFKIDFCGKLYRLYHTQLSNAGSRWFKVKGQTIFVH